MRDFLEEYGISVIIMITIFMTIILTTGFSSSSKKLDTNIIQNTEKILQQNKEEINKEHIEAQIIVKDVQQELKNTISIIISVLGFGFLLISNILLLFNDIKKFNEFLQRNKKYHLMKNIKNINLNHINYNGNCSIVFY